MIKVGSVFIYFEFFTVKMRLGDRNRDRSRSPLRSRKSGCKKVFVSNIPYEFKWKELKELFKKEGKFFC